MLNTAIEQYMMETYSRLRTPFYLRDVEKLQSQWNNFTDSAPERVVIHYATMANDDPSVLHWFYRQGCRVFVGSWAHLDLAEEVGFTANRIVAGMTNITGSQMSDLIGRVGTVLLGSATEVNLASRLEGDVRFLVRVNVSEPKKGSQSNARCMGLAPEVILHNWEAWQNSDNRIEGIHSYAGTNVQNLKLLGRRAKKAVKLACSLPNLKIVDIGGGFPAPNHGALTKEDLQSFWQFVTFNVPCGAEIWVEPGRFILAPTSFFVAAVTTVEERCGQVYVGTDASVVMFPRRLMFGAPDSDHPLAVIHHNPTSNPGRWHNALIVGNTTYSRDVLFKGAMPEVRVGDLLVFGNAGAYCRTAVPRFLGTNLPPEVTLPTNLSPQVIGAGTFESKSSSLLGILI